MVTVSLIQFLEVSLLIQEILEKRKVETKDYEKVMISIEPPKNDTLKVHIQGPRTEQVH